MWEILAEKSCGRRRKSQFKKGSDWWKFSIWNRVIGSQPIRIQLGKILWENLVGNLAEKVLMVVTGLKMVKNTNIGNFWHLREIFKPITTTKTLSNYFYLVEEVLSLPFGGSYVKIS